MQFRVISLPPFTAAASEVSPQFDFSPESILGQFNAYFSAIRPAARDSFSPRDFLYYDEEQRGLVWIWALSEDMDDGGNRRMDFQGGFYLTYTYRDGDHEANGRLYGEAVEYIRNDPVLELDTRPGHYPLGHIITPPEIIEAQGWAQMEAFVPVRLRNK